MIEDLRTPASSALPHTAGDVCADDGSPIDAGEMLVAAQRQPDLTSTDEGDQKRWWRGTA
jgi:hypothetical protein